MFFDSQPFAPEKDSHIVGMTQYYVHNFNDPAAPPKYIITYNISSCVVLLLKNIDPSSKECNAVGMVHLNFLNVYFDDKGKENLVAFIEEFEKVGGCLETASIQLIGGLKVDHNQVREKIAALLHLIAREKGIENLKIKTPQGCQLNTTLENMIQGTGQIMAIACLREGTHIRKVTLENRINVKCEFYPVKNNILTNEYIRDVTSKDLHYRRLKEKTDTFYNEINILLNLKGEIQEERYLDLEDQIKNNYCALENSNILSQAPSLRY